MNPIPQELNWVEKRFSCTVGKVFNQLCDGIEKDVETFNLVRQLPEHLQFSSDMHSSGSTIYVAQPNQIPRARVSIGITEGRIGVHEEWNGKKWEATIGLNNEGRCILKLLPDGTELEQWQFRKKALEGLFFGD